jgi:hypothetical protein
MTMKLLAHPRIAGLTGAAAAAGLLLAAACAPPVTDAEVRPAPQPSPAPAVETERADPREGLGAGWMDAEEAAWNMDLLANSPRPRGFFNPEDPGDGAFVNSDLAFQDDLVFVGNYHGFKVYDVSDPANPTLRTSVVCPGGQGDISVYGNLVFYSAQETRARIDCGTQGAPGEVNPERFRGVRIFDISNMDAPRQVAAVQTCRGSHTHTLVADPNDPSVIYVYNSGTSPVRPAAEMEGCSGLPPEEDPETSLFQIEVIRVPLASPEEARIVNEPRIFADPVTGEIAGLWPGGDHGPGTQPSRETNRCHDITSYPAIGLAAGACSGNGLLLDISRPGEPVRIDEVADPNFVFWHSATFNNDGTSVIFTDEWGGGTQPRCRPQDPDNWGANAIFRIEDGEMRHASYFKLPADQTEQETCVAHNGSLVPVPGRDIKVQAWYQGGISVFDFTDPANPYEIAFFDRGPMHPTELMRGGFWSAYWYDGYVYGSEMSRGLDVLELTPSEHLTANELEAARQARFENRFGEFNPQHQPRITWPASFAVARAYLDQLERAGELTEERRGAIATALDEAEAAGAEARREMLTALVADLDVAVADARDGQRVRSLAAVIKELADA